MKKLLLFVFFCSSQSIFSSGPGFSHLLFSGRNCIKSTLLELIRHEKKSITSAMYALFDRDLIAELVRASDRGVDVQLITDKFSKDKHAPLQPLFKRNLLRVYRPSGKGIMHNKFWVFDDDLSATGSENGTEAASRYHRENILLIESYTVASGLKSCFKGISREIDVQEGSRKLKELNFERTIKGFDPDERNY